MAIVGLEPMVKDGQRFNQKKAAEILGVSSKTIWVFVQEGLMPPGLRKRKYTFYTGRDIKRCWRNYHGIP